MRMACVHSFTIEAPTREKGREILDDLARKIGAASERLDIGYQGGFITGQPQPEYKPPDPKGRPRD